MHNVLKNLISIQKEIQQINSNTKIIAVSKTFSLDKIKPIIDNNHCHFGENKVQEAVEKWSKIKDENKNIKLHLIGKLQTNKVKYCLPLFDYIHSLDNIKLADKIANEQIKKNFKPKIFLQINIGEEKQKSGIDLNDTENFYTKIKKDFDLNIVGLMCIPPNVFNTKPFFEKMKKISENINLNELSMGMSNDYLDAAKYSATFVRIGSKIFGERN
mgnify:CR=1 FL=1|tara:strand:- start:523 stop:1167 length:645 start_codon:yes stop_codon:yes gene_type:complete